MSNFFDYINWRGDLSFDSDSFNEVDALILCQISYLNFDGILKNFDFTNETTLKELCDSFKNSYDFEKRCDMGAMINQETSQLFFAAANSKRFGNVIVTGYTSIIDLSKEEQFAAVSYILTKKKNFIAFRGTDDTIVGWKEDFNLVLLDKVPAQIDALKYLEDAANHLKGELILGGHSKGGNLAVYAPVYASKNIQNRVSTIYNLDGPGFSDEKIESQEFYQIIPKVHSFYPHFSIVGMLFSHRGKYSVVDSDQSGIMQHDPFSWHILGKSFILKDDFDPASSFFQETLNTWLKHLSKEQTTQFIETLFGVLKSTDALTNSEIEDDFFKNSVKMIRAWKSLDSEVRDAVENTAKMLFKIANRKLPSMPELIEKGNKKLETKIKNHQSYKNRK